MKISAAFALLLLAGATTSAEVVMLGPDKDTSIFENATGNSAGSGPGLFAGTNGTSSPRRSLLSFDLSSIPAGSRITSVKLTLTLGQVAGAGMGTGPTTASIGLFELSRNWGEGTTQSGNTMISGSGQGATAQTGDATWNAAFYPSTLWGKPGGDFDPAASATLALAGNTIDTPYTWQSTAALVADVQNWLDHPAQNFGWLLKNGDETSASTVYGFYSSEWSDRANNDPVLTPQYQAREPLLEIIFVPEPNSALLAAMTGALILATWRIQRRRTAAHLA